MQSLLTEIRACQVCASSLPNPPKPVLQAHPDARLLIIGQAPGSKVQASGVAWDDASGERLRAWLGITAEQFYSQRVALVPMGFCYPGRGKSGDLPPRPECAPLWHERVLSAMPDIGLTVLVGGYAQKAYLPAMERTLTATVANFRRYLPESLPLPHPSPRNNIWLSKNPWFARDVLPSLQHRINQLAIIS